MERPSGSGPPRPFGKFLVESSVLDARDVDDLIASAKANHQRLGTQCLELGLADERTIARALATQLGHPCLVLSETVLDLAALELVPRVVASQHRLLPVAIDDERITIATRDLGERDILTHIEFASGRRVEVLLALEGPLARATQDAYEALLQRERSLPGSAVSEARDRPRLVVETAPLPAGASAVVEELVELAEVEDEAAIQPDGGAAPLVLVIDDEEDVRALLRRLLLHDGYRVSEARTGLKAMEQLRKERPRLVLLDAMLPEVHGFEICRAIKSSEALKDLPVVMVSAVYRGWQNARDIQEVHRADAFLEKPFDVYYLRELVARMLGTTAHRPELQEHTRAHLTRAKTRASVSYKMGDLDDAVAAIQRWKDLDPFDPEAYLLLGNVFTKKQDAENAMRAYERAATFGPNLFAAFKNLALVYEQLGFVTRAFASWFRAAELSPEPALRAQIQARLQHRYAALL